MTDLASHIHATALADTHEHLCSEADFTEPGLDILQDLFSGDYIRADLCVAGAAPEAVQRLVDRADPDIAARFAAVQPAWEHCRHTGYGEGLRLSARLVYGLDELTPATLAAAAGRAAALHRPGERRRILAELANVEYVHLNFDTWACDPDPTGPEMFFRDISWVMFAAADFNLEQIHRAVGVEVRDLRSLREALHAIFARHAAGAVAVKAQHAYVRTLRWRERSDADAARVLERRLHGQALDEEERLCLGDWCWARGVEHAIEHGLPFKLHTGYYAGRGFMVLERTRPAHLCPLLIRYPQARFVLMHSGYPYGGELLAVAKHFPNVYADLCWAWSIDPLSTADFVRRWLHAVPVNKLFVFGGDTFSPTQTVGYAAQCRRWLTRALEAEVAEGNLTEARAVQVATRIMSANQREVFDMDRKRAVAREALARVA